MKTRTIEQSATATTSNQGFSLISDEKLLQLYTAIVKLRCIKERLKTLGHLPDIEEPAIGQEAAVVGMTVDLHPEDTVALSQSDTQLNFLQGTSLRKVLRHISGHGANQSLATQVNIAIKSAQDNIKKKNGKIAVVFSRGGSGYSEEVLCQAVVRKLPVLFVCLNSTVGDVPAHKSPECGIPSIPVDGNDVVAVCRVATESIAHARKGNGPTLIECILDTSKTQDPILKMESYLKRKKLYCAEIRRKVTASFAQELDAIIKTEIRARVS
jgi:TPP-dependent pyruvate/acetoin dehydrogenase alpha subunit